MANVPMDDVKQIWNQMGGEKDWSKFKQTLKEHRNKSAGIDDGLVDHMLKVADEMNGKSFPSSPEKLREVLMEHTRQKTISSD